ncbi:MAG: 50S ribosomal protein L6 [Patescibacteria group bacterium]
MSRLGKQPVAIPSGVTVTMDNGVLTVKGAKATLTRPIKKDITITVENDAVTLVPGNTEAAKALFGTYAAHLRNMIEGVTKGFTRILELEGVGYRAEVRGKDLVLSVGFSHPVPMPIPEGVTVTVEKNTVTLSGADLEVVAQYAANVRKVKKPEPYKGKGIRYQGEYIIRKQGKKAV